MPSVTAVFVLLLLIAQRLGDQPALDLIHHLLERALLRRDPVTVPSILRRRGDRS